jgi:uncharacterized protein (TIGR00369 family)
VGKELNDNIGVVPREEAIATSGLDFLRRLLDGTYPSPPIGKAVDMWPIEFELGRAVFEAMPSARFYNPIGIIHGGWIATLLDTVMGCAVHSTLQAGQVFVTIEMKTVFVKAVLEKTGKVRCEGKLLHSGARIASSEGKIFDGKGDLIAHGSETCMIMDGTRERR